MSDSEEDQDSKSSSFEEEEEDKKKSDDKEKGKGEFEGRRGPIKKRAIKKERSYYYKPGEEDTSEEEETTDYITDDDNDNKLSLENLESDHEGVKIVVDETQRHSIDIIQATSSDEDEDNSGDRLSAHNNSRSRKGSVVRMSRAKSPTLIKPINKIKSNLSKKNLVGTAEEEQKSFEVMKPTIRKRSTRVLKSAVKEITKITEEMRGYLPIEGEDKYKEPPIVTKAFQTLSDPSSSFIKYPSVVEASPMSPNLKRCTKIGNKISTNFLLPGIPKIIGDFWVFIELSITIFQLIFSLVNMKISANKTFNIIYICLASVNTLLACIDGFLYFYELTTCKTFYRWCRSKIEETEEEEEEEEEGEEEEKKIQEEESQPRKRCFFCHVPPKVLEFSNKWFEIIRTILGELLIYPLIVLDLFDLLGGGSFQPTNQQSRVGFSMFIVGSFYLVLSVYIGRTVMSITTIRSLQGLTSTTKNDSNYTRVIVRFLFHVIGQIFVHLLCVMSVGVKIWQEDKSLNGGSYRASPFLWGVIFGGWLIPFLGVVSYFVVNYYWIQSFSLGLFIDMIGLLEEQDFAQAVFEGGGTLKEEANDKSEKILHDVKYYEVKEENQKRNNEVNSLAKIVYPLKVPVFLLYVIFYDFVIGSFLSCLLLEFDKNHNVIVIDLTTSTGIATIATIILVVISNLHVIFVINLWMIIIILALLVLLLASPVLIVIGFILFYRKCLRKRKDSEELLLV